MLEKTSDDAIDRKVAELFPDLAQLEKIFLGLGPGSFVGLRSVFAYVRTLCVLAELRCFTFYSSRLWHLLLGVPETDWLLLRANAKLFYAERFSPERQSVLVNAENPQGLAGKVYSFEQSWQGKSGGIFPASWQKKEFGKFGQEITIPLVGLSASESKDHSALTPIYGHELHFRLAKTHGQR
ncbi:MAG: hypothetical protein N2Z22_03695, partial [Turneriella sp.]|nr:hypothetical protein [Turneriella sp.]